MPGVEPGSTAWKAAILTVGPHTHVVVLPYRITITIESSNYKKVTQGGV